MGHILEPKNVDLQINSGKATVEDIKAISDYIKHKKNMKKNRQETKKTVQKKKSVSKCGYHSKL